ncbi:MAG: hypothetical protein JJV98_13970 [Desulfosarcina sp.]|nr:hypothetical protein [Desulfobacterales bacterium]
MSLDPRPAYYRVRASKQSFGMRFDRWDVRWEIRQETIWVNDLVANPFD